MNLEKYLRIVSVGVSNEDIRYPRTYTLKTKKPDLVGSPEQSTIVLSPTEWIALGVSVEDVVAWDSFLEIRLTEVVGSTDGCHIQPSNELGVYELQERSIKHRPGSKKNKEYYVLFRTAYVRFPKESMKDSDTPLPPYYNLNLDLTAKEYEQLNAVQSANFAINLTWGFRRIKKVA